MLQSGRLGFVSGSVLSRGWGVEGEIELDVSDADVHDPCSEALTSFRLMLRFDRRGDFIAAGAHELENAGEVQMRAVFRHFSGSADVCAAKAIQDVSIACLMQGLAELPGPDGRA